MPDKNFRIFATADIGDAAIKRLRERGYEVDVYPHPEPPPKSLIIEKVRSGIDGLITTLRDPIEAEIFEAGKGTLKVVAQYAVGFDNINRVDANRYRIPFTNTADVLTEATAEFAFFALADLARKLWSAEHLVRQNNWGYWHPYLPFLGDEVTGKTMGILGTGRIGQAMIKKCIGFRSETSGAPEQLGLLASLPAVPRRRGDRQNHGYPRNRAHWTGNDQEVHRLRHEYSVLRSHGAKRKADCGRAAADGPPSQERNAAGAHVHQIRLH